MACQALVRPYPDRMTVLFGLRENLQHARLQVICDVVGDKDTFAAFVTGLVSAGVDLVQVRTTGMRDKQVIEALEAARPLVQRQGLLCVAKDMAVAQKVGADLVHLADHDDFDRARRKLHQWALVGASAHDFAELQKVRAGRPDWINLGPVFGQEGQQLGLVARAAADLPDGPGALPWFAAGGITLDNLDRVLSAGATRIAVSTAVCRADDPFAAARELSERLHRHAREGGLLEPAAPVGSLKSSRKASGVGAGGLRMPGDAPERKPAPAPMQPLPEQAPPQVMGRGMGDPDGASHPATLQGPERDEQ